MMVVMMIFLVLDPCLVFVGFVRKRERGERECVQKRERVIRIFSLTTKE